MGKRGPKPLFRKDSEAQRDRLSETPQSCPKIELEHSFCLLFILESFSNALPSAISLKGPGPSVFTEAALEAFRSGPKIWVMFLARFANRPQQSNGSMPYCSRTLPGRKDYLRSVSSPLPVSLPAPPRASLLPGHPF